MGGSKVLSCYPQASSRQLKQYQYQNQNQQTWYIDKDVDATSSSTADSDSSLDITCIRFSSFLAIGLRSSAGTPATYGNSIRARQ
jgi:hypothetical protein